MHVQTIINDSNLDSLASDSLRPDASHVYAVIVFLIVDEVPLSWEFGVEHGESIYDVADIRRQRFWLVLSMLKQMFGQQLTLYALANLLSFQR